jgi:hypothetical protein
MLARNPSKLLLVSEKAVKRLDYLRSLNGLVPGESMPPMASDAKCGF